jgi:hypothetical protein
MDPLKLDTSCTALILVDLQRGIVGMPTSPYSGLSLLKRVLHSLPPFVGCTQRWFTSALIYPT